MNTRVISASNLSCWLCPSATPQPKTVLVEYFSKIKPKMCRQWLSIAHTRTTLQLRCSISISYKYSKHYHSNQQQSQHPPSTDIVFLPTSLTPPFPWLTDAAKPLCTAATASSCCKLSTHYAVSSTDWSSRCVVTSKAYSTYVLIGETNKCSTVF